MSSTAPVPRAGGLRHRIKAAQNDLERKEKVQGIAEMLDKEIRRRRALEQIDKIAQRRAVEIAEMVALAKEYGLVPVSLGDLRGSDGNIFSVINACRQAIEYAEANGIPVTTGAVDVVNKFADRTYGETLMLIQLYYLDINNSVAELHAWDIAKEQGVEGPPSNTTPFTY